jgi:hypothetical protein
VRATTPEEQIASARTISQIARTYTPVIPVVYRIENFIVQPWVQGFSPPLFQTYWKYLDIDGARMAAK